MALSHTLSHTHTRTHTHTQARNVGQFKKAHSGGEGTTRYTCKRMEEAFETCQKPFFKLQHKAFKRNEEHVQAVKLVEALKGNDDAGRNRDKLQKAQHDAQGADKRRAEASEKLKSELFNYGETMKVNFNQCQEQEQQRLSFVKRTLSTVSGIACASEHRTGNSLARVQALQEHIATISPDKAIDEFALRVGVAEPLVVPELNNYLYNPMVVQRRSQQDAASRGNRRSRPATIIQVDSSGEDSDADDAKGGGERGRAAGAPLESDPRDNEVEGMSYEPKKRTSSIDTLARNARLLARELAGKCKEKDTLGFVQSYEQIQRVGLGQSCNAALHEGNMYKNRYTNILAYDATRVVLPAINEDPLTDYINANWIPGHDGAHSYIATQGPNPHSVNSFWRMIIFAKVEVIVMVTQLVEGGRLKCERYWPDAQVDPSATRSFGLNIHITHQSTVDRPHYTLRRFQVRWANPDGESTRMVTQLCFKAWPDHGVPSSTDALLAFRTAVRREVRDVQAPLCVHCSAGVGRTGTFITIDWAMKQCAAGLATNIQLDHFIKQMRVHRNVMVQTDLQYLFIFKAVIAAYHRVLLSETKEECTKWLVPAGRISMDGGPEIVWDDSQGFGMSLNNDAPAARSSITPQVLQLAGTAPTEQQVESARLCHDGPAYMSVPLFCRPAGRQGVDHAQPETSAGTLLSTSSVEASALLPTLAAGAGDATAAEHAAVYLSIALFASPGTSSSSNRYCPWHHARCA